MAGYPAFRYHKELAAEGKLVKTEEEDKALGPDWHDTPEKFDPKYVAPNPEDPEAVAAAMRQAKPAKAYPSHRYKKGDADNPKEVKTAEEDDALEAAEPGVWKSTPDPAAWKDGTPLAPAPNQPGQPPAGAPSAQLPPPQAPQPPSPPNVIVLTAEQKLELHTAPLPEIFERLDGISDVARLDAIVAAEEENPNGARKTLLKAVDARKRALANG